MRKSPGTKKMQLIKRAKVKILAEQNIKTYGKKCTRKIARTLQVTEHFVNSIKELDIRVGFIENK